MFKKWALFFLIIFPQTHKPENPTGFSDILKPEPDLDPNLYNSSNPIEPEPENFTKIKPEPEEF